MSLLSTLIGSAVFCAIYYGLWVLWCRHAPAWLPEGSPQWVKGPSLLLFVLVTFVFLLLYKKASR